MHPRITEHQADALPRLGAPLAPASASPRELENTLLDCIRGIARHDEAALEKLYDATASRIHGVALRFVGNIQLAEEVVSDVYYQVWCEADSYDPSRGLVQAWLLVICRSRALDALRRRDRAVPHPNAEELIENRPDEASDGMDLLESLERRSAVHEAVAAMTPLHRQLIALAFFRGLSHSEIAQREGMPLGTVKSHLRNALHLLRRVIAR